MKFLCVVVLALAGGASALSASYADDKYIDNLTSKDRQLFIFKLLNHVLQPVMYKEIEDIGRNYRVENNMNLYTKLDVVKRFLTNIRTGYLPRGEIFCLYCEKQMQEVIDMFHVLYYAKDFKTFLRTACYMRLYFNEGMFVYALTVAVRHREDCKGIVLPAPYEVYPYYFVRADVIQKAYLLKMKNGLLDPKLCELYGIKKTDKNVYIIDENIYDTRVTLNTDDRLRYFTEDIDLNTYYYYFHVDFPFWMNENIYDTTRARHGELKYFVIQQLLARYYLERLSHNMCKIDTLSFYKPLKTGYWPWLKYHNGMEMPVRYNNYVVVNDDNIENIRLVEDYELLIREAIIKGYVVLHDGTRLELKKSEDMEILGRLVYGKVDKYHGDFYRYLLVLMKSLLGLNTLKSDKYFVVPTVLDQYHTALRDPVFWQLQKRLIDYFMLFKKRLPSYTREDLYFPGVKVDNVLVDKLVTYFDDYFMDMTNAVLLTDEELKKTKADSTFLVRKRRLNHTPFKVTLDIVSDKAVDSVVRIFLGPKEDCMGRCMDLNENRVNFIELDTFIYKLNTGKNTIVRNSYEMHNLVRDRLFTSDMISKLDTVTDFKDLLYTDYKNTHTGFPVRLLLPMGRLGGLKMVLYVIVTPVRLIDNMDNTILTNFDNFIDYRSSVIFDKMPLGFPFDRHIDVTKFFTPNMKFLDIMIFHKTTSCDMKTRWQSYVLKNYNLDKVTYENEHLFETDKYNINTDISRTGERLINI